MKFEFHGFNTASYIYYTNMNDLCKDISFTFQNVEIAYKFQTFITWQGNWIAWKT